MVNMYQNVHDVKPVKFRIRMYAVFVWSSCDLYSLAYNNSGNCTAVPVDSCHKTIDKRWVGFDRIIFHQLIDRNSGSAPLVLRVFHTTSHAFRSATLLLVADNFCTHNLLVEQIWVRTDHAVFINRTVQLNTFDAKNRKSVKKTIGRFEKAPWGTWFLR